MKTNKWLASLAMGSTLLGPALTANAQYVQNAIGIPIAPGCAAGESWTKNGVRYQCETPVPSCQYGFASGPVWTGSSWTYSCNAPAAPPPPTNPGDPGTKQPATEIASCSAAITAGLNGQPWHGVILQLESTQYGLGWIAEGNLYQWGGGGTYEGTDGTYQLWQGGGGAGLDLVTVGIDDTTAGDLNYGNCYISSSTGAVTRVAFSVVANRCPGCGGSSGQ